MSGTYNWLNGSEVGDSKVRTFNVSVIDGKNEYVNAGLSFTRKEDYDLLHIATAKRVLPWLSVGTTVKRFAFKVPTQAYSGSLATAWDGGVSATALFPTTFTEMPVQVAITGDNLIHKQGTEKVFGPRQAALGAKLNLNSIFMLYGDVVENFSHESGTYPMYYAGGEVALGADFFLRGGLFGLQKEKGWGTGLGWIGPKLGVNYGYQNKLAKSERSFEHAVTMDLYM